MVQKARPMGAVEVALIILALVALILLLASRYPTMAERRVKARQDQAHPAARVVQLPASSTPAPKLVPTRPGFKLAQ